jgi:hypothetical protein
VVVNKATFGTIRAMMRSYALLKMIVRRNRRPIKAAKASAWSLTYYEIEPFNYYSRLEP